MFLIWNLPPRCTAQCQGQWPRKTWLWRTGRLWSTRTLKMKDGFSSGCWEIVIGTRKYGRHRLWARLWLSRFIPRLDLSAAGEVSELMNTGAYETYLKEECEDHWVKKHTFAAYETYLTDWNIFSPNTLFHHLKLNLWQKPNRNHISILEKRSKLRKELLNALLVNMCFKCLL